MEISYCISRQESIENSLIETILDHQKRGVYELKRAFWYEWDENSLCCWSPLRTLTTGEKKSTQQ